MNNLKNILIPLIALIIFGLFGYVAGTLAFNGVAYLGLSGALVGTTLFVCLIISRAFHAVVMSATHPASAALLCQDKARRGRALRALRGLS